MRALQLRDGVLAAVELPRPAAGPGEVLIRVRAAGITLAEPEWYPAAHTRAGEPRTGVPSHEFSGEIADTGEEVYGMNDWYAEGALAEYCVTRPEWIAPKPRCLSHAEAASVPIGALTAWQGLFDRAGLQAGERVLVHGAAGAVGIFAVQLAHAAGAHVIATVSARNLELVKSLGADEVIDYHAVPFEDAAREIDVVFDGVGGETLARTWSALKPGGRLVTIASNVDPAADARTKAAFLLVHPDRAQLVEIGRRIDAGELRAFVDRAVPLQQAAEIYRSRAGRGKIVVTV